MLKAPTRPSLKPAISSQPPARFPTRKIFREAVQETLFNKTEPWQVEWQAMPEFKSKEQLPFHSVKVHFENQGDLTLFATLLNQKITTETKYVWYPKLTIKKIAHLRFAGDGNTKSQEFATVSELPPEIESQVIGYESMEEVLE